MFISKYGHKIRVYAILSFLGLIFLSRVLSFSSIVSLAPSELFVFGLYGCIFLFCFCSSLQFYGEGGIALHFSDRSASAARNILVHLVVSLVIAGLLEGATVFGSPAGRLLNPADWSKKRLIFFFGLIYIVWFAMEYLHSCLPKSHWKNALDQRNVLYFLFFAAFPCLSLIVARVLSNLLGFVFIEVLIPALLMILCVACFFFYRGGVEWLFLYVALIFSVFLALFMPITSGISWDDQIHYQNALDTSYIFGAQETDTDLRFVNEAYFRSASQDNVASLSQWTTENNAEVSHGFDITYHQDIVCGRVNKGRGRILSLNSIGYLPSAIGLWLGRLLHLRFSTMVVMARLFSAITYSAVFFFAIKVTPVKKSLFAACGLIPTSIFMAANFSYDAWLISLAALGLAFFLKAAWGGKEDFNQLNLILAFTFMFLGLAVKAVYFPLIGLFYCVPRDRFDSVCQRRRYYLAVTAFGLLMLASFALPYLFTVEGDRGDTRGSLDVSPLEQIVFILDSPIRYAGILSHFFVSDYINPLNASSYLINYAYLGNLQYVLSVANPAFFCGIVPFGVLFFFGLFSGNKTSVQRVSPLSSLWCLFLLICSIVLVATALYVSFTPVGKNTVDGCQFRYLLPLLIPFFTCVTNVRFAQFGDSAVLKTAQMLFSVVALLACTVFLCFSCF